MADALTLFGALTEATQASLKIVKYMTTTRTQKNGTAGYLKSQLEETLGQLEALERSPTLYTDRKLQRSLDDCRMEVFRISKELKAVESETQTFGIRSKSRASVRIAQLQVRLDTIRSGILNISIDASKKDKQ
jgi:hypothetical protein